MKKILVTGAYNIGKAGVATVIYKWAQELDSNIIIYDYLMQRGLPDEKYYNEIVNNGGIIHTMEPGKHSYLEIIQWIKQVIKTNNYSCIHINADTSYLAAAYIKATKNTTINKIIVHSHCSYVDEDNFLYRFIKVLLHYIFRNYVKKNSDINLACSISASEWMFGKQKKDKESIIIHNGIDSKNYSFSSVRRNNLRKGLNLDEDFTLLHVGRFSYQKNHIFLIKLFKNLKKYIPNSKLLLVGDGPLKQKIRKLVHDLDLDKDVIFLGVRNDVPDLMAASDVFVMPSRFEGLPVTMVEAQAASLPCVVSDSISKESAITDYVKFIKGYKYKLWIEGIMNYKNLNRQSSALPLEFDASYASDILTQIYIGK